MPSDHQPAADALTVAVLGILRKTEAYLQQRLDDRQSAEMLSGLEVQESDWGAWVDAGGDLPTEQGRNSDQAGRER